LSRRRGGNPPAPPARRSRAGASRPARRAARGASHRRRGHRADLRGEKPPRQRHPPRRPLLPVPRVVGPRHQPEHEPRREGGEPVQGRLRELVEGQLRPVQTKGRAERGHAERGHAERGHVERGSEEPGQEFGEPLPRGARRLGEDLPAEPPVFPGPPRLGADTHAHAAPRGGKARGVS
jgi:hypothetical protein